MQCLLCSFYASAMSRCRRRHYVIRSSVGPSVDIYFARDTISLQLLDGFQRNLAQIFSIRVAISEKVFEFKGEWSRVIAKPFPSEV